MHSGIFNLMSLWIFLMFQQTVSGKQCKSAITILLDLGYFTKAAKLMLVIVESIRQPTYCYEPALSSTCSIITQSKSKMQ